MNIFTLTTIVEFKSPLSVLNHIQQSGFQGHSAKHEIGQNQVKRNPSIVSKMNIFTPIVQKWKSCPLLSLSSFLRTPILLENFTSPFWKLTFREEFFSQVFCPMKIRKNVLCQLQEKISKYSWQLKLNFGIPYWYHPTVGIWYLSPPFELSPFLKKF